MKTSTSFAILALFATAGTSLAAPVRSSARRDLGAVPSTEGEIANVNVNHIGTVGNGGSAPVNVNTNSVGNSQVADYKSLQLGPGPKPVDGPQGTKPLTGQNGFVQGPPTQDGEAIQDDKLSLLTDGSKTDGRTGVVDVTQNNLGAHVLQTNGKDLTFAEAQLGNGKPQDMTDIKAQIPADTPSVGQGMSGAGQILGQKGGSVGPSNDHGGVASQLLAKPVQGGNGKILNTQPIAELGYGNDHPVQPSHAPPQSAQPSSLPHPSSTNAALSSSHLQPSGNVHSAPHPSGAAPLSSCLSHASVSGHAQSSSVPCSPKSTSSSQPPQSSHSASSSQAPRPSQSASSQPSNHFQSASSSHAPRPSSGPQQTKQSDAHEQGGAHNQGNAHNQGGNGDGLDLLPGAFDAGQNDEHYPSQSQPSQSGPKHSSGPNRMPKLHGPSLDVVLASSARDVHPQQLRIVFGERADRVEPCDGLYEHGTGQLVDACISADLLTVAPKGTWKCPDEMQHDIRLNADSTKDTMNTKLGKEVVKYVRLCAGADLV